MLSSISDFNNKYIAHSQKRLYNESLQFLSEDKKLLLRSFPLNKKEKQLNITLLNLRGLPFLLGVGALSVLYDFKYKRRLVNKMDMVQNSLFRILVFNIFYYMLLVDNEALYSVIYKMNSLNIILLLVTIIMDNKLKRFGNDISKPSSNYRSFINNNSANPKQPKPLGNVNSILTKPTPFKKQIPKKSNTNCNNTSGTKAKVASIDMKNNSKLNLSKNCMNSENVVTTQDKAISYRTRENASSALSGTYKKTPTKFIENPLLSKIVKNNSTKIEFASINKEKTLEAENLSYTKLAMKKSENTLKSDGARIVEISQRLGKQTNFSKYKHFTKPKNSSMILDTNKLFDSGVDSIYIHNNNSMLFNKNKNEFEDLKVRTSFRRNSAQPMEKVVEEQYRTKYLARRNLTEREKEHVSEGLNFSVGSSIANLNRDEEASLRFSKSRNGESQAKLKVPTEDKLITQVRESHSFLEESMGISYREGTKCKTSRLLEMNHPFVSAFDHNSNYEGVYENRLHFTSEIFENENKKTKVSTKEDTIKSVTNKYEIETIEEQHFMFVKFLHSSKKMMKSQEDRNKLKWQKTNSNSTNRNVFPIEEIDLE